MILDRASSGTEELPGTPLLVPGTARVLLRYTELVGTVDPPEQVVVGYYLGSTEASPRSGVVLCTTEPSTVPVSVYIT